MRTMANGQVRKKPGQAGGAEALLATTRRLADDGGTSGARALLSINQPDGFDCPGCAWPEPARASRLEFCENGAKAVSFEATSKRATPAFFADHRVAELRGWSDRALEAEGRLTHPLRYDAASDRYVPVVWEEAFREIGATLESLENPNEAVFYTSGRTSNEAAFLYQLLGRSLGTNNFPDCSNMCHESSGVGLTESLGIGKGTVTLEDFDHADLILVVGQNPGTNHPRMLTELQAARARGASIVSMNPLREAALVAFAHPKNPLEMLPGGATPISTHYLQVKVGGDLAALTGLAKILLEREAAAPGTVVDHTFVDAHTEGFSAYLAAIDAATWDEIERESGLPPEALAEVADLYARSERVIACWAMGLTQQPHAVATIQQVVNLLLLRGNIGRAGAGACPVRGHSNVQGDRTMGIDHEPKPSFLEGLSRHFDFAPPTAPGFDTVATIEALQADRVRFFCAMGGNFVAATPDSPRVAAALGRSDLNVFVATKLNRTHLAVGGTAYLLPCLGRTELDLQRDQPQEVTVEDSMSMVHASRGRNLPASSELLSEPAIVAGMAGATPRLAHIDWQHLVGDYARVRDAIAAVLPELFHDFNERIREPGGFYLGNSARDRLWNTSAGKATFVAAPIPDQSLPEGQLRLMTVRSHDQFNTTVYTDDDRYRGIFGTRKVLFVSAFDLSTRGLADGDLLEIISHYGDDENRRVEGFRAVVYDIPVGCVAGYFPELNPLVSSGSFARRSRTPNSKLVPVTLEPFRGQL